MRTCLNCHGPMDGKKARAKFCKRDCQVAHLRAHGATEHHDPFHVGVTISIELDSEARKNLSALAEHTMLHPRILAKRMLTASIEALHKEME